MNELTLDSKIYVSSKHAAELTGYAKDYIGQMCREGRVEARLVGRNWYVLKSALEKHRFTAKSEPEPVQKVIAAFASDTWEEPRYETEQIESIPAINKLAEPVPTEEATPEREPVMSTIEAMQDAWRGWFTSEVVDTDNSPEAENSPEEEETSITIHTLTRVGDENEALNLRRIREYRTSEYEEPRIMEEIIRPKKNDSNYFVLRTLLFIITVAALGAAYVGSGFLNEQLSLEKPFSFVAGTSSYNK